jgi:uncharacterized protein
MNRSSYAINAICLMMLTTGCQSPWSKSHTALGRSPSSASLNPLDKLELSLMFHPSRYPEGDWDPKGIPFEDAWFDSADGTKLHGWYLAHDKPQGVVLFCHGNAGNIATWSNALRTVHDQAAVSILGFDYRGYGRSEGTPSEAGVLDDARAARAWLASRTGVDECEIILMGRSLGGGVAVDLAATDGARGLVLESTFTSLPEVGHHAAPWFPVRALMKAQMNSLAKIPSYHGPLLQSHGTADRLIPYEMSQQLFAAANQPKRFIPIEGGGHNCSQTDDYYVALREFVAGLPAGTNRK